MGRFKETPTPRGGLLGAYIEKAHNTKSESSPVQVKPVALTAEKSSAGRSQAVKLAKSTLPTARVNQTRSSSTASNKRKSQDIDDAAATANTGSTTTLTLRSSKNTTSSDRDINVASVGASEIQLSKRQRIGKGPRRTSRLRKSDNSDSDSSPAKSVVVTARGKSPRPARAQRKTSKVAQQTKDSEKARRQKEAIDLLQGAEVDDALSNTLPTPPADSASDTGLLDEGKTRKSGKHYNILPPARNSYTPQPASQVDSSEDDGAVNLSADRGAMQIDKPAIGPVPQSFETIAPRIYDQNFVYRTYPAGVADKNGRGSDDTSATSGDSGYITAPAQNYPPLPATPMQIGYHPMYSPPPPHTVAMMPGAMATGSMPGYGWHMHPQPPWSVPDMATHTFIISTKGQKVKGRPVPRAPRQSNVATRARNVANTYPRKQPFKAQILFTGYPAESEPLRKDATLWQICQDYPNHLTGPVLEGFVQKEWSANELCACLKDDARKVLTDRPGKDKTMVFQKRLERIKKDLVAKGTYDQLVHGTEVRPDGRPSWVKRGNVRRK